MFTHLLVPTDGSALSDAAIQMAVKLARENKARLTALHVMKTYSERGNFKRLLCIHTGETTLVCVKYVRYQ